MFYSRACKVLLLGGSVVLIILFNVAALAFYYNNNSSTEDPEYIPCPFSPPPPPCIPAPKKPIPNFTYLTNTNPFNYSVNPNLPHRLPRITLDILTDSDRNVDDDWDDNDYQMRYITYFYKPDFTSMLALRDLVGSIHKFGNDSQKTTIFGYGLPTHYYEEIRTYSLVRYINVPLDTTATEEAVKEYALKTSARLYSRYLFMRIGSMLHGYGLEDQVNAAPGGSIRFVINETEATDVSGYVRGGSEVTTLAYPKYFQGVGAADATENGKCSLMGNLTSPFRIQFVYASDNDNFAIKDNNHGPDDKLVCLSIATYAGSTGASMNVNDFSLINTVLPSFLSSTKGVDSPTSRYRFAMYLGVQPDPFYDNREKMNQVINTIESNTVDRSFSLRIFYIPLVSPTMDIAYKWNVLLDQGYRDGCDYLYQYSDDAAFLTPWVDEFITYLESHGNFGVAGATDTANVDTITLSFTHRTHISIIGSYWPTHLKNWWSDNWAHQVYGPQYTLHSKDIKINNTQSQGVRYSACISHGGLFNKLITYESRPRILAWLACQQPCSEDLRDKIMYLQQLLSG